MTTASRVHRRPAISSHLVAALGLVLSVTIASCGSHPACELGPLTVYVKAEPPDYVPTPDLFHVAGKAAFSFGEKTVLDFDEGMSLPLTFSGVPVDLIPAGQTIHVDIDARDFWPSDTEVRVIKMLLWEDDGLIGAVWSDQKWSRGKWVGMNVTEVDLHYEANDCSTELMCGPVDTFTLQASFAADGHTTTVLPGREKSNPTYSIGNGQSVSFIELSCTDVPVSAYSGFVILKQ
ncbi:hypothetical protein ACFL6C_04170 [Myxococcota bacterium]